MTEPSESKDSVRLIEQRKATRHAVHGPVLVKTVAGHQAQFQCRDISQYGMRLIGPPDEMIPDDLELSMLLPGGGQLRTTGRVVWCVKNEVFGVEFGPEANAPGSPLPAYIMSLGT